MHHMTRCSSDNAKTFVNERIPDKSTRNRTHTQNILAEHTCTHTQSRVIYIHSLNTHAQTHTQIYTHTTSPNKTCHGSVAPIFLSESGRHARTVPGESALRIHRAIGTERPFLCGSLSTVVHRPPSLFSASCTA